MCWEMDYRFLADQQKAQDKKIKEERRAGMIDQLLSEANTQAKETKTEQPPVEEIVPAK